MAYDFIAASSEYLYSDSGAGAPVTAAPLSMACWAVADDDNTNKMTMTMAHQGGGASGDFFALRARDNTLVEALNYNGATSVTASTSASYPTATWFHMAGVWASASSRAAYLDGGNKGTNSTSNTPSAIDNVAIGAIRRTGAVSNYMNGQIAEAAIWNVALSDADVAALATGISPLLVRPDGLVGYWPIIRGLQDLIGGRNLSLNGTPTVADHVVIRYPFVPAFTMDGSGGAAPGAGVPPIAMAQYRRRRVV